MNIRIALRRALRALDQPSGQLWPWGVLHHGTRVALLVAIAFLVHLMFPLAPGPDLPTLEEGMVAEEDLIAQTAFSVPKPPAQLAEERDHAAGGVIPVFEYRESAMDSILGQLDSFMARVDSAANSVEDEEESRRRVANLLSSYGIRPPPAGVDLIHDPEGRERIARVMESVVREEIPKGIALPSELDQEGATRLQVRRAEGDQLLVRDSVLTAPRFYDLAASHPAARDSATEVGLLRLIAIRFFEPSLRFDAEATEADRAAAREAVSPVQGRVLQGERIVGANEVVSRSDVQKALAHQQRLAELDRLEEGTLGFRGVGSVLFNILVLTIFGLLLFFFHRSTYADSRHVFLLATLMVAVTAAAAVVARTEAPVELIPIAFPALAIAALWDGRLALNFALVVAILLTGQAALLGVTPLTTMVLGGAAAALSVRVVRRRSQAWVFSFFIAGAYIAAALTVGLLRAWEPATMGYSAMWGTVNAVASALLAMGFLPVFEGFTRITTDQTLLELGDLNRPLLKRLALEAPGTYAHSINVANLAEAAARGIGANTLLTRVGIYYHDVGKMLKPQYFIENQPQGRNPHDKLKPATSAGVVRNHVVEGIRMAEEAKLPESVKAFIAEHHGTQSISFFYERAVELNPDEDINRRDFSYPGPRPRSRETAIAMLADSVESATRVLTDPTEERVRELVDRIVEGKMAQHQLDLAPLTLAELTRIKKEFVSVLSGMHHQRIDYPTAPAPPREPAAASLAGSEGAALG